jgi:clan AA aspartic protease (TIGR02281 family)
MRRTTFAAAMSLLLLAFPGIGPAFGQAVQLENRNGLYLVPVQINGALTIDFAIDSGATQVTITADVASTLSRMGALAPEDYGDSANFRLADGTKLHATRVILRKIKVGTHEYSNVPAIVIPSSGAQLLGQSLLTRLGTWSIDNERHLLIIGSEPPVDPSAPKDLDTALVRATEVMEGHCAPPAAPLSVDANFATVQMMRDAIAAFKSFQAAG